MFDIWIPFWKCEKFQKLTILIQKWNYDQKCSFLVGISEIKGYYLGKKIFKNSNCDNFVGKGWKYLEFDSKNIWREICLVSASVLAIIDFHWKKLHFSFFEISTTNVQFFQSWEIFTKWMFDQMCAFHVPTLLPNLMIQCRTPKKLWLFLDIFCIYDKKKNFLQLW